MMMITRRHFLKLGLLAGASLALPTLKWLGDAPPAQAFSQSGGVSKFAQPLRGVFPLDANGIPVAVPDGTRTWANGRIVAQHYSIDISQYLDQLHPDLGPTTLWGYRPRNTLGGATAQRHLGGIVVAQKGTPVQMTFQNKLPKQHILPVDTSIMGAMGSSDNRTAVHLHGGEVPWISDGGPFAWFDDSGSYGPSMVKNGRNLFKVLNPRLAPGQAEYYYPNNQSARFMWYHDHAVGITRLNAYAGIASVYIIRDAFEGALRNFGLPDFIENGGREIPLVFQDKIFVGADIGATDPTWSGVSTPGSLWYPHVYEDRWGSAPVSTLPDPTAVPEMFGDTMLVNGVVHPFAQVEPRRYRLRILDACQARFLNLQLYEVDSSGQPNRSSPGPDFLVIGTEGGFLLAPVTVPSNRPMNFLADGSTVDLANPGGSLLTAPGERWDVIIDFSGFAGKSFILYNDAPAPFPMGDPINDYQDPSPTGLNTRTLMRIDVGASISGVPDKRMAITPRMPLALNPLSGVDPLLVPFRVAVDGGRVNLPPGVPVRRLTLNEVFDDKGRLIQMLGTNQPVPLGMGYSMDPANPDYPNNYARAYDDPATETPSAGSVEVWQIANLTADTHPMHFHLVNVQILARQSFTDASGNYLYANGTPTYTGSASGPAPTELGWKETCKMNPGEVTTVIMRFSLPTVPFFVPTSPRTGGHEYVWHCHILDHEEHDMMRPLVVI
jgi:spore coat protein A